MRRISADYIFPISSVPIEKGVITIADDGTVLEVSSEQAIANRDGVEFHKGIICPGFINTHCHLELSHMRSEISENKGMAGFVKEIISKRNGFSEEKIQQAIIDAEAEMIKNGIVAVGDISNNNSTFKQKAKGNIYYHTFIEAFDLTPDKAVEMFENAITLKNQLQQLATNNLQLSNSINPHAPYTVSEKLFQLISEEAIKNNSILSIHNQESLAESELFVSKSGAIFETFSKMGINMDFIKKTGLDSLRSTLPKLPRSQKILLVHNTYTSKEDIEHALNTAPQGTIFWCTCPNANKYIEGKIPNYEYFIETNAGVTIGTDSLASNWSLSVLDELKTIAKDYPQIPLQTLLLWATKNGADFLGLSHLGSIEKNKKPGLNLLKNVEGLMITERTEVQKLI